jgi:hypothetical protein
MADSSQVLLENLDAMNSPNDEQRDLATKCLMAIRNNKDCCVACIQMLCEAIAEDSLSLQRLRAALIQLHGCLTRNRVSEEIFGAMDVATVMDVAGTFLHALKSADSTTCHTAAECLACIVFLRRQHDVALFAHLTTCVREGMLGAFYVLRAVYMNTELSAFAPPLNVQAIVADQLNLFVAMLSDPEAAPAPAFIDGCLTAVAGRMCLVPRQRYLGSH